MFAHSQLTLCVLCYFDSREAALPRMRVVKTANNLPTMFVLERVESDPEYDQLKAELYELGDYVSMRYAVEHSSVLYCIQVDLRRINNCATTLCDRRLALQYKYFYGRALVREGSWRPFVWIHAEIASQVGFS